MSFNEGNLKEQEVIYDLNDHLIKDLSNNMRTLMRNLFGVLDENKRVYCRKVDDLFKTDFIIEYDGKRRNVSMKSGKGNVMHNEVVENFTSFLKKEGISERTIETILLFHYGDGTTDGTGETRKGYEEIIDSLKDRIKEANAELNKDMDFILKVLERCVFLGAHVENLEAEAVYFGDRDYGVVASKRQFILNVRRRGFDYYSHLHIGPLLLRPHSRYISKEISYSRNLHRIVCYWPKLREDIEYMAKRFNF